jgi:hypothetical protein
MRRALPIVVTCSIAIGSVASSQPPGSPPGAPILTVLDGRARLIRATAVFTLSEGVRLRPGDIIETSDRALTQFETGDGTVVSMAGSTRAMLLAATQGTSSSTCDVFVLAGIVKATAGGTGTLHVTSPMIVASAAHATIVASVAPEATSLFAETGDVRAGVAGSGAAETLRSGQFWSRRAGLQPQVAGRPDSAFISSLPRAFLDPLPSRRPAFKDRDVPVKGPREFTYAEVEPWLHSTPAIRRLLVDRWRSKANDPAFRQALLANLKSHPEWSAVLFPEKERSGR